MKTKNLNSFFGMNLFYTDILSNHGVRHQPANKLILDALYANSFLANGEVEQLPAKTQIAGYSSIKEFRYNVKAPIQIPIAILSSHIRAVIGCIENTLYLALNVVILDFHGARNNVISILNNVFAVLFNTVKAIMDITLSLIQLPICSVLTLRDYIAPQENDETELSEDGSLYRDRFFPSMYNIFPNEQLSSERREKITSDNHMFTTQI